MAAKRRNMMSAFAGSGDNAIADPDVVDVPLPEVAVSE